MLTKARRKYIGDKAFYRMLLGVALPIMVQNGMTNFVSFLDNIMVGQLGTEQMSGVAIVNQLIFIFFLFIFGGLSGVGIFTAQYYGNHDDEGIRHTFRYKLWLGFIITVVITFILLKFGPDIISFYLNKSDDGGNLEATLNFGLEYLGVILFMLPIVYITQVYCSTLRECGETKVPMIAGVTAVLSNLVLDYLLIFGKLGLPAMGVKGAALATCIARVIEMMIVLVWCSTHKRTHTYLRGIYKTIKIPSKLVGKYFITGIPLLLNEGLWSVGIAMLNQAYSVRGLNVVAGMNIATTINNLFNIVFVAMGDAVAIIIGQHLGAGDMKKAKEDDTKIIAFAIMSSMAIGAIMFCLSGLFPKAYTEVNPIAQLVATHFIMVQALVMPKDAFLHTSYFTIRAGGKTIITFLFDSFFILVVSVPLANVLVHFTTLGPATIFALVHAADLIKCVIGFILVKKGVWMKNIVT
ncbi:putative efflux protein, MATE family [Lachnospiraceae bacterium NE2001]|nr:putative efflux protein, MATE family [Lachnospiraceae bacterium NE2001]